MIHSPTRRHRLRAPLLWVLAVLLTFEAAGGIVIFIARTAYGVTPGEFLHVAVGVVLMLLYAIYQWRHWYSVRPWLGRLDYGLGLLAASSLVVTQASGLLLGWAWLEGQGSRPPAPIYDSGLSAVHNIGSMLVLTFVGAHVGAVLKRARTE